MTCSLDRAHEKPIPVADNVLSVSEMNVYIAGIFRYNYCEDNGLYIYLTALFFRETVKFAIETQGHQMILNIDFARPCVMKHASLLMHSSNCLKCDWYDYARNSDTFPID